MLTIHGCKWNIHEMSFEIMCVVGTELSMIRSRDPSQTSVLHKMVRGWMNMVDPSVAEAEEDTTLTRTGNLSQMTTTIFHTLAQDLNIDTCIFC